MGKYTGKVREFYQSGKVGTMIKHVQKLYAVINDSETV